MTGFAEAAPIRVLLFSDGCPVRGGCLKAKFLGTVSLAHNARKVSPGIPAIRRLIDVSQLRR